MGAGPNLEPGPARTTIINEEVCTCFPKFFSRIFLENDVPFLRVNYFVS